MAGGIRNPLHLYRTLMRNAKNLQFTDKSYYRKRIRTEFEKNRQVTCEKEINRLIEKGNVFLEKGRLI